MDFYGLEYRQRGPGEVFGLLQQSPQIPRPIQDYIRRHAQDTELQRYMKLLDTREKGGEVDDSELERLEADREVAGLKQLIDQYQGGDQAAVRRGVSVKEDPFAKRAAEELPERFSDLATLAKEIRSSTPRVRHLVFEADRKKEPLPILGVRDTWEDRRFRDFLHSVVMQYEGGERIWAEVRDAYNWAREAEYCGVVDGRMSEEELSRLGTEERMVDGVKKKIDRKQRILELAALVHKVQGSYRERIADAAVKAREGEETRRREAREKGQQAGFESRTLTQQEAIGKLMGFLENYWAILTPVFVAGWLRHRIPFIGNLFKGFERIFPHLNRPAPPGLAGLGKVKHFFTKRLLLWGPLALIAARYFYRKNVENEAARTAGDIGLLGVGGWWLYKHLLSPQSLWDEALFDSLSGAKSAGLRGRLNGVLRRFFNMNGEGNPTKLLQRTSGFGAVGGVAGFAGINLGVSYMLNGGWELLTGQENGLDEVLGENATGVISNVVTLFIMRLALRNPYTAAAAMGFGVGILIGAGGKWVINKIFDTDVDEKIAQAYWWMADKPKAKMVNGKVQFVDEDGEQSYWLNRHAHHAEFGKEFEIAPVTVNGETHYFKDSSGQTLKASSIAEAAFLRNMKIFEMNRPKMSDQEYLDTLKGYESRNANKLPPELKDKLRKAVAEAQETVDDAAKIKTNCAPASSTTTPASPSEPAGSPRATPSSRPRPQRPTPPRPGRDDFEVIRPNGK